MTDNAPDLGTTQARQGRRGRHALVILTVSLALVVLAFLAVFLGHFDNFSGRHGNREAPAEVARTFDEQPNTVKQTAATAEQGSAAEQASRPPAGG